MKSLSSSLSVNGVEVGKVVLKTAITIPNTGWVANTGDYAYKLNVAVTGVLATDYVMVDILPDYDDIATEAELSKYCLEYAGGVTLYAKNIPSGSISATCTKIRG